VLAFSTSWNELRARVENRESLTKGLVAGGPVEAKEDVLDLGAPEGEGKEK
jgi:hypothetical protein